MRQGGTLPFLAVVFAALPVSAGTPHWSVLDLGRLYKDQHCMAAAQATFESLLAEVRIDQLRRSQWVTYADGIAEGSHDAIITCTYGDGRGTRATLVIHSHRHKDRAPQLTRRVSQIFDAQSQRITQAWKDSYR